MGLSTISRAKRDQTWREDVVTNGIGRVEGIAVDWIAGEQHLRHVKKTVCMTKMVQVKQYQSYCVAFCCHLSSLHRLLVCVTTQEEGRFHTIGETIVLIEKAGKTQRTDIEKKKQST